MIHRVRNVIVPGLCHAGDRSASPGPLTPKAAAAESDFWMQQIEAFSSQGALAEHEAMCTATEQALAI